MFETLQEGIVVIQENQVIFRNNVFASMVDDQPLKFLFDHKFLTVFSQDDLSEDQVAKKHPGSLSLNLIINTDTISSSTVF